MKFLYLAHIPFVVLLLLFTILLALVNWRGRGRL